MNIIPYQSNNPSYQKTQSLRSWQEDDGISYSYALRKTISLIGRILGLLLLLALLVFASVVWLWVASFRSGWRFWNWLNAQPSDQTIIATNVVYHFIIMVVSPFALFANWSQRKLQQWLGISFPSEIDLRSIIEEQLGIKLGDGVPCFPASTQKSSDA